MRIETNKYHKQHNSGFTLVELSIVIVIIGLILTGVTAGQKLVQNAKLRSVVKEIQTYDLAIKQFKDKFKYYPGDLPNAATYWGAYAAVPPITGAANGDGNWQIIAGSNSAAPYEDLQLWRQLALAGYITGTYTGAVSGSRYAIGINAPVSAIAESTYFINYQSAAYYGRTGHTMQIGSLTNNSLSRPNGALMTPANAYAIDVKIDDGLAASGNFYAGRGQAVFGSNVCASANVTAATATYLLTDTTVSCRIAWWLNKNQ